MRKSKEREREHINKETRKVEKSRDERRKEGDGIYGEREKKGNRKRRAKVEEKIKKGENVRKVKRN